MSDIIAILCSDLHLSHKPPVARSAEKSWYCAMQRPLRELQGLAKKHQAPIICAGDVFDTWRSPVELVNWAIRHVPVMFAIPGQHDLPHHNIEEIERTPFWTLFEADVIDCRDKYADGTMRLGGDWWVHSFPWNAEITPVPAAHLEIKKSKHLAVVHKYIHVEGHNYPDAPSTSKLAMLKDDLATYDAAVFGDNHSAFVSKVGKCNVINTGTFMRRKRNEIKYKPMVGLLYNDGTIEPHYLDTSKDKFLEDAPETVADEDRIQKDIEGFVQELSELEGEALDFTGALRRYIKDRSPNPEVTRLLLEGIGDGDDGSRQNRRKVS